MTIKALNIKRIRVIAIFLPLLLLFACIDEYEIEVINKYENAMVIDGKITNLPGPYTITLSTSTSIEDPVFTPVRFAQVMIVDDIGNSETLSEIKEGVYQTSETGIQGTIGRSYKLIIQSKEGKNYESGFEELLAPVAIESLTAQLESRFAPNLNPVDLNDDYEDGIQFYVTTETSENNQNFYCWELEETFEIHSTWRIAYIYNGYGWTSHNDKFRIPSNRDTLHYCWKTINNKLFTSSTLNSSTPKITNLPLNYVSFYDEMLQYKYSVMLNQYTISENTHLYFKALLSQEDGLEGLYTKQPYQIEGNVHSADNPDEAILGYFMVAGTTIGKRLSVSRPTNLRQSWKPLCDIDDFTSPRDTTGIDLNYRASPGLWPVYVAKYEDETGRYYIAPPPECIDCTKRGGVTKKPDYWDQ